MHFFKELAVDVLVFLAALVMSSGACILHKAGAQGSGCIQKASR